MFRYFGFTWNPGHLTQAACAQQLDDAIRSAKGWQPALSSSGVRVYTIGSLAGVNGSYPLPFDQGVILGRLFRRQEGPPGYRDIEISPSEGDRILLTDGRALVDDYWGRYIAILKPAGRSASVLRDPSGALPCYCGNIDGVPVFYSWLEDLIAFAPSSPMPRVKWDIVAALLSHGQLGGCATGLEGVAQLVPGRLMPLEANAPPPAALWSAVAIARRQIDDEPATAAARLRQTVLDCVHAWSSCYPAILLRLSGGVDSAILLGSLSATGHATKVTCLNYHSPGSDSDERAYARLAATKAGVELVEMARNSELRLHDILGVSRTPTPESYIGRLGTDRVDASVAALLGAPAMFMGTGGDQLFFQLRCTWPAADYLSVHGLGCGFVRAAMDAARLGRVSLLQSMRNAMTDRRGRGNQPIGSGRFSTLVRREAIDAAGPLDRHLHPDLLLASDLPIGKLFQVQSLINPLGYYDPYLREAAPELVSPLFSQPLIELCLALPTWVLTHGGRGRALVRRAFARDLPREIATRQSKGGMEEHVAALFHRNLPFARSLLLDGHLVRQGLLDRKKVEAALDGRLSAIGGYIGEIHHCMAIEAWLQRVTASATG